MPFFPDKVDTSTKHEITITFRLSIQGPLRLYSSAQASASIEIAPFWMHN